MQLLKVNYTAKKLLKKEKEKKNKKTKVCVITDSNGSKRK